MRTAAAADTLPDMMRENMVPYWNGEPQSTTPFPLAILVSNHGAFKSPAIRGVQADLRRLQPKIARCTWKAEPTLPYHQAFSGHTD